MLIGTIRTRVQLLTGTLVLAVGEAIAAGHAGAERVAWARVLDQPQAR